MKNRKGFVSNSSSSSFVIISEQKSDLKVKVDISLSQFIDTILKTKEEVDNFFKKEYCFGQFSLEEVLKEDTYIEKKYNDFVKEVQEGKVIYMGSAVNDSGDPLETFICEYLSEIKDFGEGNTLYDNY